MDFNTAFDKYKGYISQIAIRTSGWDHLNYKNDIIQELSIELWRCLEKYKDKGEQELDKILKTAFHNRVVNLIRFKKIDYNHFVSFDNKDLKGNKFSDSISKNITTEKDYQDGITDVISNLPNDSAMKVLELLNVETRGQFIKGTRKAFGEVQDYFKKG